GNHLSKLALCSKTKSKNRKIHFFMSLSSSLRQVSRSIKRVVSTHYPPFLFGLSLRNGEVPVFIYHEVDKESFAGDLAFLRDNGYRTLSADEFFLEASYRGEGKRILLTFDDARRNFWDVAFPILKEYNARATLFVPTYWIGGRKGTFHPE